MPRKINRLNTRMVETLKKPGRHADGSGLYLSISKQGGRSWVFMYEWHRRTVEIGLGSARLLQASASARATEARKQLDDARARATEARLMLSKGINPKNARKAAAGTTFGDVADRYIEAKKGGWRNAKHAAQWEATLKQYAAKLREMPVVDVDTAAVLDVLKPIWIAKAETAARVRGRIERVLDAAKAEGHRTGENPARWRGNLKDLLPERQRIARGHHAAMPYSEVGAFLIDLRARGTVAALALEYAILTAARTGEVLGAKWSEIDIDRAMWTVPAERMKAGREHRVPLSTPALKILRSMQEVCTNEYVFPGQSGERPLSERAFGQLPGSLGKAVTVHGFRSSFRDWAAECTSFPNEVCEMALAHVIGDKTEAAYRRGDLFAKRVQLMNSWAAYITKPIGKVVQFAGREVQAIGGMGYSLK
jgi:integrase